MAIQYKLKNNNTTNELGNILYIEDITGEYSEDNTGGYGDINGDRSNLALFLVGSYMSSKNKLPVTIKSNNPTIVDKFEVIIPYDGWYKFSLLSIDVYNEDLLPTYSPGRVYYKVEENKVYVTSSDGDGGILFTEAKVQDLIGSSYEVAITESFIVYNNSKIKIRLNSLVSDLLTNNVDYLDKRLIRLKDNYNALRAILQGAVYEFCRGNKSTAQKSIEFLNTNNYVSE